MSGAAFPDSAAVRARFPALAEPLVFLDNAGGSQLPECVIDAATAYLRGSYVQLGADYTLSRRATATVERAHTFAEMFMNARGEGHDTGRVVLGPSTTALCHVLADSYAHAHSAGALEGRDELIISTAGHEADVWPWMRLGARGMRVQEWRPTMDPSGNWALDMNALASMLSERTALVCFPHVSNILGDIWDAAAVTRMVHAAGARVCVDGVAFAPHRAIDVRAIGCDWYVYSLYKVFGPHMAAMFGTHGAFAPLEGPNHYFIPRTQVPYKFELGGVSHEGAAMVVGGEEYYRFLAGAAGPCTRSVIERAFAGIERVETALQARLLGYLNGAEGVTVRGPGSAGAERVSTVSFTKGGGSSREIALALNARGFAVRYGHFYSKRLVEMMGLAPDDGVVRASLLHYNTADEVDRLIDALKSVL